MSGRGGAGNIYRAQEQKKLVAEDLEANSTPTPPSTSDIQSSSSTTPSTHSQPYAHTGRGGAGNWYEPAELSKTGSFSSSGTTPTAAPLTADSTHHPTAPTTPQISTPWHPETQELPLAKAGRGGAGNFVWGGKEEEEEKKREEERRVKEVGERVERDVEAGLAKPPGVVLGGAKAGRGW